MKEYRISGMLLPCLLTVMVVFGNPAYRREATDRDEEIRIVNVLDDFATYHRQ